MAKVELIRELSISIGAGVSASVPFLALAMVSLLAQLGAEMLASYALL
jgi:hypothetical protein